MNKIFFTILTTFILTACGNGKVMEEKEVESNDIDMAKQEEQMILEKVNQMTLEDKIEQMLILDYSLVPYGKEGEGDATKLSDATKEVIAKHNFGGIILFRDNTKETKQTLELVNSFQKAATQENTKYKIPLFMCVDQEGGRVTRLGTGTSLPGNMALGAINDTETTKEYATIIGEELSALDFNVDFAPVLDVNNNPSNPVIGVRSFSSDAKRVAKMGEAYIEGLHSQNIASTLKHFPGHGDTATDSHTGLPLINKSYDEIQSLELIPFQAGINKGADMIMTAHIVYPQIETTKYISKKTGEEITLPATLSKTILTDILRNDMGYEGVIVTDALNMSAIKEHFDEKDVAKYALNAGVDILLMPVSLLNDDKNVNDYVQMIATLVKNGEVPESRINESVTRILKLKYHRGLLEKTKWELTQEKITNALNVVGSEEHHNKELQIAKDAITLVKGKEILPIQQIEKVLFLTAYANEKNSVEYAIQLLKQQQIWKDSFAYTIESFEGEEFSQIKNNINDATVVVITTDTSKRAHFDNNEKDGWQGRLIDQTIEETHKQNKKAIFVSCMLPYDVARYDTADAVLCAYGNGINISAAIIKLFANEEFKATLPVDIYQINDAYQYTNEIKFRVKH